MIPLRDDAPRYSTPYVNYFLLGLNTLVFLFELSLPPDARQSFIFQFGVVPARITALLQGAPATVPGPSLLPILTSMFLHASWMHLIFNMWALYIFGDNIEDYLGHFRYLLLYLTTGVAASLLHVLFNPGSRVPSVGASGAIAGIMGAYFVLYPTARVLTLVPFLFVFFLWLPAWVVLGVWFLGQFLSGAATSIAYSSQTSGGIAFWAHVGGFLAGVGLIKLFPSRPRRYRYFRW
ncbi:MAG TPA: rhomboid family intramembrane serine protease [Terriglobales bacterium]|nr:rhomboid family intramembrane serine protease [Terriglobales bacterium]